MKEVQFRNKVTWFTFFFSVLVIWVHSFNSELFLGRTPSADVILRIEDFFGGSVAQIAVPGFFLMSAYLFFRNFSWSSLERKWMSRVKSVLVPYIVWNALYYAGYLLSSRIPVLTDVVGRGSVPFSLDILAEAILHYIYNPVFWYLYQLILLIILAPILFMLLKNAYLGILFLVLLITVTAFGIQIPQLNLDALLYYSFGAFGAIHLKQLAESSSRTSRTIGILFLMAAIIFAFRQSLYELVFDTVMYRLMAPAGLWLLIDGSKLPKAREWMTYNFFLYATHFALVRLVNKAGAMILPPVPASPLILYFLMPAAAVALSYAAARLLKRWCTPMWGLLNGGRL